MALTHEVIQFRTGDPSEIVDVMALFAREADGKGWLTFTPWVDDDFVPERKVLRVVFSSKGPELPSITWVPAHGDTASQVGLLHPAGKYALQQLADAGVHPPDGWTADQDHPKRGLVFRLPPASDHATTIRFATDAAAVLSELPIDDRWVARKSTQG